MLLAEAGQHDLLGVLQDDESDHHGDILLVLEELGDAEHGEGLVLLAGDGEDFLLGWFD